MPGRDDRHALVVRRERAAEHDAEQRHLHPDEGEGLAGREQVEEHPDVEGQPGDDDRASTQRCGTVPLASSRRTLEMCRLTPSSMRSGKKNQPWLRPNQPREARAGVQRRPPSTRRRPARCPGPCPAGWARRGAGCACCATRCG